MKKRARAAQLAGVSMLAIVASLALPQSSAMACEAIADTTSTPDGINTNVTTNFVNVTCTDVIGVEVENSLFDTTHGEGQEFDPATSGTIFYSDYDGSGNDILTMVGGEIGNVGEVGPPPVAGIFDGAQLGAAGSVETLAGNDTVTVLGGTIGEGDEGADSVNLGDDDDTFLMSGGELLGSLGGGAGNDTMTLSGGTIDDDVFGDSGDDTIDVSGAAIIGSVFGDGGDELGADTINISAGSISESILAGDGADKVSVSGTAEVGLAGEAFESVSLGAGDDNFDMSGGELFGDVSGGLGNDTMTLSGGEVGGSVVGGDDDDTINVSGTVGIGGDIDGGEGADTVAMSGGTVDGSIFAGDGDNTVSVSGGSIGGSVFGGDDADKVSISGTAVVGIAVEGTDSVFLGDGDDIFEMSGGELEGDVSGGDDNDTMTISGGQVGDSVFGDDGDDTVTVSGGSILGSAVGGIGNDTLTFSGGTVGFDVVGLDGDDTITVSGAAINGSVFGDGGEASGADTITVSAGSVGGSIFAGDGKNTVQVSGGTIGGSVFGGDDADEVTISGTAQVGIAGEETDSVFLGDGADIFEMSGGELEGDVSGGAGIDTMTLSGGEVGGSVYGDLGEDDSGDTIEVSGATIIGDIDGGEGADTINVLAGSVGGSVFGSNGDDTVTASGGSIEGSIFGGDGVDNVSISGTAQVGVAGEETDSVFLGDGDDIFEMSGGELEGNVGGGFGNDAMTISGGQVGDSVFGDDGDDTVTVSGGSILGSADGGFGNDTLTFAGGTVGFDVVGLDGDDLITVSGGTIGGSVFGDGGEASGTDTINVSAGNVMGSVYGGGGDDEISVSGGTVDGAVIGEAGDDKVTVSGGTIKGGINAETVQLNGGTISGNITGLSENTLIIQAENLSLKDGVLFQGTNVVGTISNTKLATGSANFAGFSSVTLEGESTLRLAPGVQQIAGLQVLDGSTLEIPGAVSLVSPTGGPGNLVVTNATLDMKNNSPTDVLNVGNLSLTNATLEIDVNAQQNLSDLINAAGALSAAGANTVSVNLIGLPNLATSSVIALAPIAGETAPAGGTPSALFTVTPDSPLAGLFDLNVITGADGGLYLVVAPTAAGLAALLEPRAAIDSQPIETVTMTVYDILNDAVLTQFNLMVSASRADAAPGFGIYASGQAAFVKHDGFNISGAGFSAPGPSFTANDFSLAASVELNAAEYFGLDQSVGLDIGMYGGYTSSEVDLDPTTLFPTIGSGDNKSGMIGSYGLFRSGTTYGLVSATGFFGNTDIVNGILQSTGEYGTAGVAVTGSAGHVYQINDNWRFDLRGGILGVYFQGDSFEDSKGNDFGRSHISFGAVKLEPGIFAQYPMEDGRILSPYARLELTQRFGYENESSLEGVDFFFDDADFSASLAGGVNYQISKTTTVSSELRSKVSSDSNTFAGKIGLKARF